MKKCTRKDREAEEALVVARAADRAESGGRGSGIFIGESRTRVLLSGRVLGTKAREVTKDQLEVLAEQEQQTPPRRHSGRTTRSQTTPVAPLERPRRRGRSAHVLLHSCVGARVWCQQPITTRDVAFDLSH
jgi:hypothetical protein